MRQKFILPVCLGACALIALFSLMGRVAVAEAPAEDAKGYDLRVLDASASQIILELVVTDYQIVPQVQDGVTYESVVIPGSLQHAIAGEPQVPTLGTMLGVPTPDGLTVQVVGSDHEGLAGIQLPSVPVQGSGAESVVSHEEGIIPSPELGAPSPPLPMDAPPLTDLAQIGESGYLRDQAFVQIQFHPVQVDPDTGDVRLYRRIQVEIKWNARISAAAAERPAGAIYDALLQRSLLNYSQLPRSTRPAQEEVTERVYSAQAANVPTLKIAVTSSGIYQLTFSDLFDAGFDPAQFDPTTIQMHNQGGEIPIYISGENDGTFDSGDSVLFYGMNMVEDPYATQNVYWLTAGTGPGQRMEERDGTVSGNASVPTHYPTTIHAEHNSGFWGTMPYGGGEDHWFWGGPINAGEMSEQTVSVTHPSPEATTAEIQVRLKGYTSIANLNPDHHTQIYLNGNLVDDQKWDGQRIFDHRVVTVPHAYLTAGENTVRVKNVGDTGAKVDGFLLNWIEVTYWHTYNASNDSLRFTVPAAGTHQVEVAGFGSSEVGLFDITDPSVPARIIGADVVDDGSLFRLRFDSTATPQSTFFAQAASQFKKPDSIQKDQPSSLRTPTNRADYIIITHRSFYNDVLRLAEHRENQGLVVMTVDVQDVYDEFSDGIFRPEAIRDFLAYAYQNWQSPAPTYVVLAGGASFDYKQYRQDSRATYVPSKLIETGALGLNFSDSWFAAVHGDDVLPDMLLGRLPAHSKAQMVEMVDKIVRYEQNPPAASWNSHTLFVADDDESLFQLVSNQLASRLPAYYSNQKVYVSNYPPGDPTTDIVGAINQGKILVNYVGHGNVDNWAIWKGGRTFNADDISKLTNVDRLPVVTVGNCYNGYFGASIPSTAEVFLYSPGKGAVAVLAPTGLETPWAHQVLLQAFYDAIFQDDLRQVGAASAAAKVSTYALSNELRNLVQMYILFGDPATEIGVPTNYPYVVDTVPAADATDVAVDQEIQIQISKPMSDVQATLDSGSGTPMSLPLVLQEDNDRLFLFSHPEMSRGARYTVTVSGTDRQGNALQDGLAPTIVSFTTSVDVTPPSGEIRATGGTTTAVPMTATITAEFSEPVRRSSVTYTIVPEIPGFLFWDDGDQIATFQPQTQFAGGQQYTFTVLTAEDRAGNSLSAPLVLVFTVQAEEQSLYLPFLVREK